MCNWRERGGGRRGDCEGVVYTKTAKSESEKEGGYGEGEREESLAFLMTAIQKVSHVIIIFLFQLPSNEMRTYHYRGTASHSVWRQPQCYISTQRPIVTHLRQYWLDFI